MNKFQELNLNEENQKWVELLTNNEADEQLFKNFYDRVSPMFGILSFRKYLLKEGRGQELTAYEINKAKNISNKPKLIEILSELFLEPLSISEINRYIDSAITADELIQLHSNHLTLRFSSILLAY